MSDKIIENEVEFIAQHRANPKKYWRGDDEFFESMRRGEQDHRIREAYLRKIKKLIKQRIPVPPEILAQRPEYQKAYDDYQRYLKAWHTSHANASIAVVDLQSLLGYKLKRQDGKRLTETHLWDIENGVVGMERVIPGIRDAMRRGNLTLVHTNGRHPFLSLAGGTYMPSERSINVGIRVEDISVRALAHELGHWLDYEGHGETQESEVYVGRRYVPTRCYSECTAEGAELARRALNDMNASVKEHYAMMRKLFPLPGEKSKLTLEEEVTKVRVGRYWKRPTEVFARLTEQYVATKLDRDSAAAESPAYYQKHSFYWDAERFAVLMPLVEQRIGEAANHICNLPLVKKAAKDRNPKALKKTASRSPEGRGKIKKGFTVRFSPTLAAEEAQAKGYHDDLSPDEKEAKLRKLLKYDFSKVIQDGVIKQRTYYNRLASCYFPHMGSVRAGGKRTPKELFGNLPLLIKAMDKRRKLHLRSKVRSKAELAEENQITWLREFLPESLLTASSIRKVNTYSGTQAVSNFSPVAAAALYHKFLPEEGGIVFDPSCGWGGRLLGAISCKRVHKYIGCDPGTETFKGLERMRDELLPMARSMGRHLDVEIYRLGSETKEMRDALKPNSVGLVFSSPPYFAQEIYTDDPTQSWKKYPDQESWLNGFMGDTLDNCHYALKPGGILAINIANVSSYKGSLKDDFVALAKSKGFTHVDTLTLLLSAMPGAKQKYGKHKHEPVFVFKRV